jgi:hypothetical protein
MSYTEWTKEKTQYGMKKEVDKANEMVKQVATEKEKKKAKAGLVYDVLDRRWWAKYDVISAPQWRQLSDMRLFFCSYDQPGSRHNSND